MRKQKVIELDILRALAFFAVVGQHIIGVYWRNKNITPTNSILIGILFNLCKFAVPVFIFVSGLVLFYNYYDKKINYLTFIWKRFLDIILPFLIWTVIYRIYNDRYISVNVFNLSWCKKILVNIIRGDSSYHLWYVVMIFQFYLLVPVFFIAFKNVQKKVSSKTGFSIILGLFGLLYLVLLQYSYTHIFKHSTNIIEYLFVEFRSQNFIFYIFYFILGAIAGIYIDIWRSFVKRCFIWSVILSVILFAIIEYELMKKGYVNGKINLSISTSLKPTMFLFTLAQIIFLNAIALKFSEVSKILSKIFNFISSHSYQAYLAHALMINYSLVIIKKLFSFKHLLFYYASSFILCCVLSLMLAYLIDISSKLIKKTFINLRLS